MQYHWLLPHSGTVKINVHGETSFIPYPNGNTTGIGMIIHDCEGELRKISAGILPSASALDNKLNAILHGLKRGFEDDYKEVILETDNLDALQVFKNFHNAVPEDVAFIAQQIMIRLHDPRWKCTIVYIYPERNPIVIYLEKLGSEKCKNLYTFIRPIGAVKELLNLDLGFGHVAQEYQDIEIQMDEEDPVDFGSPILAGEGLMHGGYAFHEDYFALQDDPLATPAVLPAHDVVMKDYIAGLGAYGSPQGDFPAYNF